MPAVIAVVLAVAMFLFGFFGGIYRDLLNGSLKFGPRTQIFFALAVAFLVSLAWMLIETRRNVAAEEAGADARQADRRNSSSRQTAQALLADEPAPAADPATPATPATPLEPREKVQELIQRSDREIEDTNKMIADADKLLKEIDDQFENSLKDKLVAPGKFNLCYVRPEKPDSLIVALERHWADRSIKKRVEQRGADSVTIWLNLGEKYAQEYADGFQKLNVKAWVEAAAPKSIAK